ncbi:MAG: ABC transporter permease [Thermoplasmatales archaeon]|nr:ABC transporter permease [Thermoplasmatales archaeon]
MAGFLREVYGIAYADLAFLKRNIVTTLISSLVSPILYLIAFGYGMRAGDTEAGVSYIAYVVPGIVAISSMTAGFSSTAQKILIQRLFHSSFDEMVLSSVRISSIVVGKSVIGMVRGLMGTSIMLAIGCLLTPELILSAPLILSVVFCCFTFALLGVMAGLLVDSTPTLNMVTSLVILPMTFMCGTLFSIDSLPDFAGKILWALPLTHSSQLIRSFALGHGLEWVSLLVLSIYAAAFFAIDHYIIRNQKY